MQPPTVKVWFGARIAFDVIPEDVRNRLVTTVEHLQETDPGQWPANVVQHVNGPEPLYLLRLPPDYLVFLRPTGGQELEITDILREGAVRAWQEMAKPNGSPHG